MCAADLSTWIKGKGVFAGRLWPKAGYNFSLRAQGLVKSLNACHLTFALACIKAKVSISDLNFRVSCVHCHGLSVDLDKVLQLDSLWPTI